MSPRCESGRVGHARERASESRTKVTRRALVGHARVSLVLAENTRAHSLAGRRAGERAARVASISRWFIRLIFRFRVRITLRESSQSSALALALIHSSTRTRARSRTQTQLKEREREKIFVCSPASKSPARATQEASSFAPVDLSAQILRALTSPARAQDFSQSHSSALLCKRQRNRLWARNRPGDYC